MKIEIEIDDGLLNDLRKMASQEARTLDDYINLKLGDVLYGHNRHMPPWTDEEYAAALAELRAKRGPKRKYIKASVRDSVFKRDGGVCRYCGGEIQKNVDAWHIDHVVPVADGGSNDPANLALACAACNLKKAANPA